MENESNQSTESVTIEKTNSGEMNFQTHTEYLNEIGQKYPREYLVDMYDNAFTMVLEWMKENAPKEIYELMDDAFAIEVYTRKGRDLSELDLSEFPEMFQRITTMAYKTGHSFQFPC